MLRVFAWLFPAIPLLACGKPIKALLSLIPPWIHGIVWAHKALTKHQREQDRRQVALIREAIR